MGFPPHSARVVAGTARRAARTGMANASLRMSSPCGWESAQRFLERHPYRIRVGLALGFPHDRPEEKCEQFLLAGPVSRHLGRPWRRGREPRRRPRRRGRRPSRGPSSASRAAGSPGRSTRLASSAFAPAPVVRPDSATTTKRPKSAAWRDSEPRGASPARPRSSLRSQRAVGPGEAPAATAASNQAAVAASAERRSAWSAERPGMAARRAWSAASAGSAARCSARASPRAFLRGGWLGRLPGGPGRSPGPGGGRPRRPGVLERHGAVPGRGARPGIDRVDEEVPLPEELPVRSGSRVAKRRLDPRARGRGEGVRVEHVEEVPGRVRLLHREEPVVEPDLGGDRAGCVNPVDRAEPAPRSTALAGGRVVRAADLGHLSVRVRGRPRRSGPRTHRRAGPRDRERAASSRGEGPARSRPVRRGGRARTEPCACPRAPARRATREGRAPRRGPSSWSA